MNSLRVENGAMLAIEMAECKTNLSLESLLKPQDLALPVYLTLPTLEL